MKSQRIIEMDKLGPLEVCVDPPVIYWDGVQLQGWRGAWIRLLSALIRLPNVDPAELAADLGIAWGSLSPLVVDVRRALKLANIPLRITGRRSQGGGMVEAYNLEIDQ